MFPLLKDKLKQYDWDTEVILGIRSIAAPGHTPSHTAFVVVSGKGQLMALSDTTNINQMPFNHPRHSQPTGKRAGSSPPPRRYIDLSGKISR
jgi:glyoxylase-like metal-dependent hydrolase (beta-lactamase superfamily II)